MLREAVQLIDQWTADTAQLTGVFWQWRSGPFRDEVLGWLRDRISHVLETRSVVHQLSSILTPAEVTELKVDSVFEHFEGINPLHSSNFSQPRWEAATAAFTQVMVADRADRRAHHRDSLRLVRAQGTRAAPRVHAVP